MMDSPSDDEQEKLDLERLQQREALRKLAADNHQHNLTFLSSVPYVIGRNATPRPA